MTDIITTADKLACARRELSMRRNAYPRLIEAQRMSAGKAAHELACMEAIVGDYEVMVRTPTKSEIAIMAEIVEDYKKQ